MYKRFMTTKNIILLIDLFLVIGLIWCDHVQYGPTLNGVGFSVLVIGVFLLAVYRPRWVFWLFVGMLPLEIISLSPEMIGSDLRPYQLFGGAALVGYLIAIVRKKDGFTLPATITADWLLLILVVAGFMSAIFAPLISVSLFQALIVLSFFLLYMCVRLFVRTQRDIAMPAYTFLLTSFVVVMYAIYQNWCFGNGCVHNEVMPGRPNATFPEADWFGMFTVFVVAVLYTTLFFYKRALRSAGKDKGSVLERFSRFYVTKELRISFVIYISLIIVYIALLITVARSAWLGASAVIIVYLIFLTVRYRGFVMMHFVLITGISLFVAYIIIVGFNLTTFEIGNRAQSTGGLQEITVACSSQQGVTELSHIVQIESLEQLGQFDCRHINLEEIATEEQLGSMITTVHRADPNVSVRKDIYTQSFALAKEHWLFGIGWGSSAHFLGTDDNGTALNASNIFLEIWLSTGIVGLGAFLAFVTLLLVRAMRDFFMRKNSEVVAVLTILGLTAIIIPNLFNAGLLLGFIWVFFGIIARKYND